ncbi:MAG: DNA mismatch repair endonuclease MutL [Nanoarchaeota archaeon]|nr:DNA mismatch repair endonuclease MutL [Nanoarchaeota archaeon]
MIRVLDEKLVNKIAAGEVIERPVNVIKELVENSLDAGATQIQVTVNDRLIKVVDNGQGMVKEDLQLCVVRHATSKINDFDDLKDVVSYGFRGEALSSIGAVSDLRITSRYKDYIEGYELRVEGGVQRSLKSLGCSVGTTIEVMNLFFNTPVRKAFLDFKENERIVSFLEKFALANKVHLKLNLNNKVVIEVNAEDLLDRIAQVYGVEVVKHMKKVEFEEFDVKVLGYVSTPALLRRDKSGQAIFVNGRLVDCDEVSSGLYDAFKSILFVNKHPMAVLNIEMKGVDVNVHPAKKIVKFTLPEKVYNVVFNSVRSVFKEENVVFEAQDSFAGKFDMKPRVPMFEENKRFQRETQVEIAEPVVNKVYEKLPDLRVIGNIAKTFFLAEGDGCMYIIDQHVVEERINYEKFMAQFMNAEVEVQELISPELIEFSSAEAMKVKSYLEKLKEFGYYLEEFGENTFRLSRVPILFNKVKGKELLLDLLVDFKEVNKEKIITMMACRNAIKAGDTVSVSQLVSLLKVLDKCELPFTCPHGRPSMIKLSIDDVEKMFRRKGF